MNARKSKKILFYITLVIAVTLCIQVYWNYKNYEVGKQQLINDVQTSLDNAVDHYFTQLATRSSFQFVGDSLQFSKKGMLNHFSFIDDSLMKTGNKWSLDTLVEGMTIFKSLSNDSLGVNISINDTHPPQSTRLLKFIDSTHNPVEILSSKIIVSF